MALGHYKQALSYFKQVVQWHWLISFGLGAVMAVVVLLRSRAFAIALMSRKRPTAAAAARI